MTRSPSTPKRVRQGGKLDDYFASELVTIPRELLNDKENHNCVNATAMGPQSQHRKKGSQAIRKRPNYQLKSNSKQMPDTTTTAVCPQCVAIARAKVTGSEPPHKAHEKYCPRKKSPVATAIPRPRAAEKFLAVRSQNQLNQFFATSETTTVVDTQQILHDKPVDNLPVQRKRFGAEYLQGALDESMGNLKPPSSPHGKSAPPVAIIEMTKHLLDILKVRVKKGSNAIPDSDSGKQVMATYEALFDGQAGIRLPDARLVAKPSPYYHSIQGQTIYLIRWEWICPGLRLDCVDPDCDGELIHDRFDSKSSPFLARQIGRVQCNIAVIAVTSEWLGTAENYSTHCHNRYSSYILSSQSLRKKAQFI